MATSNGAEVPDGTSPKPKLVMSQLLGRPPYVLDPADLDDLPNPCPWKMGAAIRLIDDNMIVKYGSGVRLAEAEAMHIASHQTSVVVPRLEGAYILNDIGYIIMSWEEGEHLDTYWDEASEDQRADLIAQLKSNVHQMRQIKGDFIGGVDGSACVDGVFAWDYGETRSYGPYPSIEAFNEGICSALDNCLPPFHLAEASDESSQAYNIRWRKKQLVRSLTPHDVVFTHGDLHRGNIKVRKDGTVVICDWGLAGFWPAYWEFYRATFNGTWRPDFAREVEKFVPPYYKEAFIVRHIYDYILG